MSNHKELTLRPPNPASEPRHPMRAYAVEKDLTIHDWWRLLGRRRGIVFGTTLLFVAMAMLVCIFSTRRYQATAELQVQKEQASALGLRNVTGEEAGYSDALQENIALQTQAGILSSDTLALKVIQDLHLESTQDFRPKFSPVGWFMGLITPEGPADPPQATLETSPRRRMSALRVFSKNLKVKPVPGTRLIDISYLNPDPKIAADVVNHLTEGLADYNFQTRHKATSKTAEWLAGQLSDLRKQSEDLQAKVARSQRDSGVLSLGGVDAQGREQTYSTVVDKLQQATTAYSQAQSNRIMKNAMYQVAKTGDSEALSGLSASPMFAGASGMDSSLTLIQNLRMQQADLQSQLAQISAKFGPAYPRVEEMREKLEAVEKSIHAEVRRVADRAKNDYEVARQVEYSTRQVYEDQKRQADALNDKTIEYTILRQEANESRALYEGLFKQLKEAGVLADFRSNNISVVDPARVPAKPAKPNVLLYLAGSLLTGLIAGCFGALLRDGMDRKIQSLPELEAQLGQTTLGILPYHRESRARLHEAGHVRALSGAGALARLPHSRNGASASAALQFPALNASRSPYIEALRALRTSLLLSKGGSPPQVVLVTSSIAAEGKSMLSLNLAAVLAQQGKRVLLVDADLRRPILHHKLKVASGEGLSSFLAGQLPDNDAISVAIPAEEAPGLYLLPAGPIPPYPAELLGSQQMRNGLRMWREQFDFVVIDGSPVLPVTDSVVLSGMVDFTLLVARHKLTERQSLDRSYRLLEAQAGHQKIGVVLNAVRQTGGTYYEYYGYKSSSYYGSDTHADKSA